MTIDSIQQAANCLRDKARRLMKLADEIEAEAGGAKQNRGDFDPKSNRYPTVNDVRNVMSGRSLRRGTIASELNVPEKQLDQILTPENGFLRNERGWVSYVKSNKGGEP